MHDLIKISVGYDHVIYYDIDKGMYWVRVLQEDGVVKDIWFDAYRDKECKYE